MSNVAQLCQEEQSREFKRSQRLNFVLQEGYLDAEKAKDLKRNIPADSPAEKMEDIEAGIQSGKFELLDIYERREYIGFTVFVIVDFEGGKELLSIATYAKGHSDVTIGAMPLLEDFAKARGCQTIRLHTMRTGLVRKLSEADWFVSEIILRKELN